MSDYSLPETITVLGQTLTYEDRGFYFSDPAAKYTVVVWVPIPNKWMLGIDSPEDLGICRVTGTTLKEAEENLVTDIKAYVAAMKDRLQGLEELLFYKENEK